MKWFQAVGGFWPTASFPNAASAIKYVAHFAFERYVFSGCLGDVFSRHKVFEVVGFNSIAYVTPVETAGPSFRWKISS